VRRKYRGVLRTPKVGYGSNKKTRNLLPNYKLKFVVNNMKELECLLMNKDKYCAEIGKNVGAVLRIQIIKRAKELGVDVTNQKSQKVLRLEKKIKKTQ
jgi:large subunit ribosomal protein L32e